MGFSLTLRMFTVRSAVSVSPDVSVINTEIVYDETVSKSRSASFVTEIFPEAEN